MLELMEMCCEGVRADKHHQGSSRGSNLCGREAGWMDRPCTPLWEGGWSDGPHAAVKRFEGSAWAGHCHSCNPAAFQKAPISACSVMSKSLPPVQSTVFLALMVAEQRRHGCSGFGCSESPKPAFVFGNLWLFQSPLFGRPACSCDV